MNLKDSIIEYVAQEGLSSKENDVAEYFISRLKALNIDAYTDFAGNVRGRINSDNSDAKTILLEAHMDRIGLMVSAIDENGFIKFTNLGGIDERILPGMEVKILCKNPICGVIVGVCSKDENGEKKNPRTEDMRVDIGLNKADAEKIVSIGDGVLMQSPVTELLNNRLSGGAMDNRSGVAAILNCVERLNGAPKYNIEIMFTTQEELGLHGAYAAGSSSIADAAIAVDVTHGATPDSKEETGVFPLGSGAVICRGPNLHYKYSRELIKLAKEKNIPYAIEVASGGSGTTAWALQVSGGGIPVMLISIPLRYMHTDVETLQLSDVSAVSDLLYEAVTGGIEID